MAHSHWLTGVQVIGALCLVGAEATDPEPTKGGLLDSNPDEEEDAETADILRCELNKTNKQALFGALLFSFSLSCVPFATPDAEVRSPPAPASLTALVEGAR